MRFSLWGFVALLPFLLFAEEKKDYTLSEEESEIEFQNQQTNTKKLLKDLENYESYRPDSYTDAGRNPFQKKRYQFDLDDDK
jgi:dienelactone hydrolase